MAPPTVTLALLPLENISGSPDVERLGKGLGYDLLAELARFPALGVIAADSVQAALEESRGEDGIAARVGARYLLGGSLRRFGDGLRLNLRLTEAGTGRHLWAGRYDGADLPAAQDEIAAKVANALAVRVDQALLSASRRRPPASLAAFECWLLGMECLQRGTGEADAEGLAYFERALEADPHYARAYAGISLAHFNEWSCQMWSKWEEKETLAYAAASRAEALDPEDAVVQVILAKIEQYRRDFDHAGPRLERIREMAPNDAGVLIQLAGCYAYQGDAELGVKLAQRAIDLNPIPPPWYYCYAAYPLFVLRRYEESVDVALKAPPGLVVDAPAYRAAACAYLGRTSDAARFLAEFRTDFSKRIACGRELAPEELLRWALHVNPFRNAEDTSHLAEGLRLAGLEGDLSHPVEGPPRAWPIGNVFRREGDVWTLGFESQAVTLADRRGLHDLRRLLSQPGTEIACTELIGAALHAGGVDALDTRALGAYRARLREIDAELEELSESGDSGRAERIAEEKEAILEEVRRATGLGGRTRKTGGADEKARTAVTWRIRDAIKRIGQAHPALGRHLSNAIRTGAFCVYQPERQVEWKV